MVKVLLLWHKLKSTTLRFILTMPKEVTMEVTKQTLQEVVAETPPEAKAELPHAVMEVEEQLAVWESESHSHLGSPITTNSSSNSALASSATVRIQSLAKRKRR